MTAPRIIDPQHDGSISAVGLRVRESAGDRGDRSPLIVAVTGAPTDSHGVTTVAIRRDGATGVTVVYIDPDGSGTYYTIDDFGAAGMLTDLIAESTGGAGVTVDGLLLQDGGAQLDSATTNINDDADPTKQMDFDVSAVTPGASRTLAMPDADVDLADVATYLDLTATGTVYNFTENNLLVDDAAIYPSLERLDVRAGITARDLGSVPSVALLVANQVTDLDTVTIGADVYEFIDVGVHTTVAIDTNIAVAIGALAADTRANLIAAINDTYVGGHPVITLLDAVTPALANGTEPVLADAVGTTVRIRLADVAGGTVVAGDPDILLAEAITDVADVWSVGDVNLNTLAGVAAGMHQEARTAIAVTAAMITNGLDLEFPFAVGGFLVQVRSAAGVVRGGVSSDTLLAAGTAIGIVFGGGVSPDIQATDIVTVHAWSAPA